MKYDSYDDYKWFLFGCMITSSPAFWGGDSSTSNKTKVSTTNGVGSLSNSEVNNGD